MWTDAESREIQEVARSANPAILTHAIPHGLQVTQGPDAVVHHLVDYVPQLLG